MGGILHTINPRLFDDQLVYIANHAEDRVLLYDRAFAPIVERMKPQVDDDRALYLLRPGGWRRAGFAEWIAATDGDYTWVEGDERDPCGLCYTSGTTGNPKGVLYEHRSTMLHTMAEVAPDLFDLSAPSVVLPIVPMFHANAWGMPWAAPMTGCKLVLSADYRPAADLSACSATRRSAIRPAFRPSGWHDRAYRAHGRGSSADSSKSYDRRIGRAAGDDPMVPRRGIEVGHAWGMTETSPIGTCRARHLPAGTKLSDEEQVDYIARQGRSPFGVELRTVDDDGNVLPRDGVPRAGSSAGARGSSSATSRKTKTRPTTTSGSIPAMLERSIPTAPCRSPTARRM